MADDKTATLYRMVLPEETCPFGVRAKQMLEENGFTLDEHILRSRDEVDAFERKQGVETTPQIFIGGERIGGSDDLERYLSAWWKPTKYQMVSTFQAPCPFDEPEGLAWRRLPLCRREIALMRRLDRGGMIHFIDASDGMSACPRDRDELLTRFHAQENGRMLSGAAAFGAMWRAIPLLRPIGNIARNPWILAALEQFYRGFLIVRPHLQTVARRLEGHRSWAGLFPIR